MSLPKSLREEQKEAKEAYLKERDAKKAERAEEKIVKGGKKKKNG